jgi:hypothetical protein
MDGLLYFNIWDNELVNFDLIKVGEKEYKLNFGVLIFIRERGRGDKVL